MKDYSNLRPEKFDFSNTGKIKNWFSNFVISPIESEGIIYNSVENYFQAHKTLDIRIRKYIASLTPGGAKSIGRKVKLRADWEQVKYDVMLSGLRLKFKIPNFKEQLLATGYDTIIEWNNWNDKIWGVSIKDNRGQNLLGNALMLIREELREIPRDIIEKAYNKETWAIIGKYVNNNGFLHTDHLNDPISIKLPEYQEFENTPKGYSCNTWVRPSELKNYENK